MNYSIGYIAKKMKEAREKKNISQRELSAKTGIPQSHISKIEKGAVDLQTSNLIELSRALDLELMLIPRQVVPAVQNLLSALEKQGQSGKLYDDSMDIPAYRLDKETDDG